jgi:hypothetical protein
VLLTPLKPCNTASEEAYAVIVSSFVQLQPGSHPTLDSESALVLATNSNEFVRQPSDVRTSWRSYVFRVRKVFFEFASDGINAVDQNLLLSTPDDDSFDHFVEIREPLFRCQ